MSKIVTVVEMVERIKEHYNLNDTLLASDLGISRKAITGWRNGNIPKVETYKKVKELYYGIEEIEINNTEAEKKERYELKFPPNGTILYFNDITTGSIREIVFNKDKMQLLNMYSFGMLYKTREEAVQQRKELLLLKRIRDWAEENNESWTPNWRSSDEKYSITFNYYLNRFWIFNDDRFYRINKLPHFKSELLGAKFINEFGDEIVEVFC